MPRRRCVLSSSSSCKLLIEMRRVKLAQEQEHHVAVARLTRSRSRRVLSGPIHRETLPPYTPTVPARPWQPQQQQAHASTTTTTSIPIRVRPPEPRDNLNPNVNRQCWLHSQLPFDRSPLPLPYSNALQPSSFQARTLTAATGSGYLHPRVASDSSTTSVRSIASSSSRTLVPASPNPSTTSMSTSATPTSTLLSLSPSSFPRPRKHVPRRPLPLDALAPLRTRRPRPAHGEQHEREARCTPARPPTCEQRPRHAQGRAAHGHVRARPRAARPGLPAAGRDFRDAGDDGDVDVDDDEWEWEREGEGKTESEV